MTEKENIEYEKFLQNKKARITKGGFIVDEKDLNPQLFQFQKYCVKRALENGKFALFEDCGLGKTIEQLEWSQKVIEHTNTPVLIIAPLAVVGQTIKEGQKFGYVVNELRDNLDDNNLSSGIYITNYDNIDNVNPTIWGGGLFLMKVLY